MNWRLHRRFLRTEPDANPMPTRCEPDRDRGPIGFASRSHRARFEGPKRGAVVLTALRCKLRPVRDRQRARLPPSKSMIKSKKPCKLPNSQTHQLLYWEYERAYVDRLVSAAQVLTSLGTSCAQKPLMKRNSDPLSSTMVSFRLIFNGIPNRPYTVQESLDLLHWNALGPATADQRGLYWIEYKAEANQRFYRSVYP